MIEARDPAGTVWRVRRRWASARLRLRWRTLNPLDGLFDVFDGPSALAVLAIVIVLAVLIAFVLFPLAVLLLEVLLFVLLVTAGIAGRVLLRRPWTIEASSGSGDFEWHVQGWRSSREAMREVAAGLERGERPPRPLGLAPAGG